MKPAERVHLKTTRTTERTAGTPEPLKLARLMREFGEFMEKHRELV